MNPALRLLPSFLCLASVFATPLVAEEVKVLEFQNGVAGYTGCQDSIVVQQDPDAVLTWSFIGVDLPSSHSELHSLIRFDSILGTGNRRIPVGSRIISARLIVQCNNPGNPPRFHRILIPWTKSLATWNNPFHTSNSTPGIQPDDIETSSSGISYGSGTLSTGFQQFDITTMVQEWSNGMPNWGFAWLPTGYNAFTIDTSESTTIANRPKLSVTYSPPAAKVPNVRIIDSSGKTLKSGNEVKFPRTTAGSSRKKKFFITNTGSAPLGNIVIVKSGKTAKAFKASRSTLPVIAPGQTSTFNIVFKPSKSGKQSATFKILSNDPDDSPLKIVASGVSDL